MKQINGDKLADSITYLAEQLKADGDSDVFDHNITHVFDNFSKNIYNSFRNDFDYNVVDGLYAISESIDKLAKAIK